jgi:hypothetical protein
MPILDVLSLALFAGGQVEGVLPFFDWNLFVLGHQAKGGA